MSPKTCWGFTIILDVASQDMVDMEGGRRRLMPEVGPPDRGGPEAETGRSCFRPCSRRRLSDDLSDVPGALV